MASIVKRGNSYLARVRTRGFDKAATFDSKRDAVNWARRIENEMGSSVYIDSSEADSTTLKDAFDRYEREITPKKKGAPQEIRRIKWWSGLDLAYKTLPNITGVDLAKLRDQRLANGISGSTIRNDFHLVSNLYKKATKEWGMKGLQNPVAQIELPPPNQSRDRRLESGEEKRLFKNLADLELECAIILFIETAMRRSELIKSTLGQLNLVKRYLKLPDTKNRKGRCVPLSSRAVKAFRRLIVSNGVENDKDKFFTRGVDWFSHAFQDLCKKSDIEDLHLHDLRHEATSRLAESGKFNILELMSITGHSNPKELSRYFHARAENLAKRLA